MIASVLAGLFMGHASGGDPLLCRGRGPTLGSPVLLLRGNSNTGKLAGRVVP